jgi:ribonuclease R
VAPDDPLLPKVVEIRSPAAAGVRHGDKVLVEVDDWPSGRRHPRGRILRRLGAASDPGVDMLSLIHRFQLPLEFPADVLAEAQRVADQVSEAECSGREDWRDREIITIDPADARDFDDAIGLRELPGGGWELAVHIADVAHYVRPGTAVDREALRRGNSVYLADRVLPMLPEGLSNGICSLRPNEDRLTRAAILTFDAEGVRRGARFVRAVIRSGRRYAYEEAFAEMKSHAAQPESSLVVRAWKLASLLRRRRFAAGSLDLDFPEVKVVVDAAGQPVRMVRIEHDESHQLIEEFMLAANEAVAEHLRRAAKPAVFRVHEEPNPDKLEELSAFLSSHAISAGDLSVRRHLQEALRQIAGRRDAPVLKLAVLKSLKRAAYHADPLGHYGLAMNNYTHFTSPIRRYADLVVHRVQEKLLWPELAGRTPDYRQMGEMVAHLSETERHAADAENESRRMKEMAYFEKLIRSASPPKFKAAVMEVRRFGLFVELVEFLTRGIVRVEDFGDWDADYDPTFQRFRLARLRRHIKAGDVIDVRPVRLERERSSVGFALL